MNKAQIKVGRKMYDITEKDAVGIYSKGNEVLIDRDYNPIYNTKNHIKLPTGKVEKWIKEGSLINTGKRIDISRGYTNGIKNMADIYRWDINKLKNSKVK